MQDGIFRHADGILVKDFFDRCEALPLVRKLFRRRISGFQLGAHGLGSECLQFLAEDNGIRTTRFNKFDALRRERCRDVDKFLHAVRAAQLPVFCFNGQNRARGDGILLLKNGIAVIVEDRVAILIHHAAPVLQVDPDTAGHAQGRHKDRRDAVRACNNWRVIDERNIGACFLAGPKCDVIHARHPGGADTHRALFGNQHHAFVRMLRLQGANFLLRRLGYETLTVQLAVRPRVCLVAGRHQVRGDIALGGNIGDDFNLVFDIRQFREELGLRITLDNIFGDRVARAIGFGKAVRVRRI